MQSQLAALETTLPPLRQKLDQTAHLLAVLAGHAPAEWQPVSVALTDLTLPSDVPVSLPSQLVRQRPDILVAEAQLHSASAAIGVATAALLPSFTISSTYGTNNTALTSLFSGPSGFWSVGANLAAPLFHGGTLWFQRKAAIDGYQQAEATYRETVLSALGQVADTLRALEHDAELLQAQRLGQVHELAHFIHTIRATSPDRPVLVMGDLNINGASHPSDSTTAEYIALRNALSTADAGLVDLWASQPTAGPGYTNSRRRKRIDYIFVAPRATFYARAVQVNEFPVATTSTQEEPQVSTVASQASRPVRPFLSDHAGVEAHFVWAPPSTAPPSLKIEQN
jgi:endonuclease/exonuclease/phosphatase family metal-dependent hydrolase